MNRRHPLHSAGLWLGLLLAAPFLRLLLAPNGLVIGNPVCDNPVQFYYFHEYAGRCLREGIVPLWNPHLMMGFPFLADGIASVFHPLSFLFVFLPAGIALNWLVAACFVLTGLFFYGWLRALKLGSGGAFSGALIWCFSNILINRIHAGHLSILLTLVEMPMIMMFWERYRRTRRLAWLVGIAPAYGAMILAAFPQLVYYFSIFFMIWVLAESAPTWTSKVTARREGADILFLGVFIALGAGIGAVQLWPMADFVGQSFRQHAAFEFCASFAFQVDHAMTLLVPRLFGYNTATGPSQYWGRYNYWEMTSYIGLLPLALVVPGLLAAPRKRAAILAGCAVLFFVVALGDQTPLFRFLYDHLPFFNGFRGVSKTVTITQFCMVTLAAFGIDGLLREHDSGERKLLRAAIVSASVILCALAAMYAWLVPGAETPGSHWQSLLHRGADWVKDLKPGVHGELAAWSAREIVHAFSFGALGLMVLIMGLRIRTSRTLLAMLVFVMMADLGAVFVPLMKTYPESIVSIPEPLVAPIRTNPYPARILSPASLCNTPMHHGICTASGFLANNLARFNDFANVMLGVALANEEMVDPFPYFSPKMKALAIEWAILPSGVVNGRLAGQVVSRAGGRSLVRIEESCPRAWLASAPVGMDKERALEYVTLKHDPLHNPAIEHSTKEIVAAPLRAGESAAIVEFTPMRIRIEAHAEQPRVLVLSEAYERNWTATVNGQTAELFPAEYVLRGIIVPAGHSRVVMEYRPRSFVRGAWISLISLAIVAGVGFICFISSRRGDRPALDAQENR